MIRSMTGYGEAERDDLFVTNVDRFERDLTEVLRKHVFRGHVSAYVSVDRRTAEGNGGPRVDLDKARQYGEALEAGIPDRGAGVPRRDG